MHVQQPEPHHAHVARIRLSRPQGNFAPMIPVGGRSYGEDAPRFEEREDVFTLEITDENGARILNATMSVEAFANLMSTRECVAGYDLVFPHLAGKIHEIKTEHVPYVLGRTIMGKTEQEAAIAAALTPFEVDGWKARRGDYTNGHHRDYARGTVSVSFSRYIDPD